MELNHENASSAEALYDDEHPLTYKNTKVRDLIGFAIFVPFFAFYLGVFVFLAIKSDLRFAPSDTAGPNWKYIVAVILIPVATVCAVIYPIFLLIKSKPKVFIFMSLIGGLVTIVGSTVFFYITSHKNRVWITVLGVISLLFFLLFAYLIIKYIKITAFLFKTAARIAVNNKTLIPYALFNDILIIAFFFLTWVIILSLYYYEAMSNGAKAFLYIAVVLVGLWIVEIVHYTQHTVVAGLTATWLLQMRNTRGGVQRSLMRVLKYSLGTVLFGALIIMIVQVTIQLLKMVIENSDSFLGWICVCLLDILDYILQMFSEFVFVEVAISGKGYLKSAKATLKLFKKSSQVVMNYVYTLSVIRMFTLFWSIAAFLVFYFLSGKDYFYAFIGAFLFANLMYSFFSLLHSAVITIAVCYVKVPDLFKSMNRDLDAEVNLEI